MGAHQVPDWLEHCIEHLEHVLPAQAPIRDFVHHNTLHGFQHLPFAQATAAVRELTGASCFLPEDQFRALLAAGRIDREDLAAALRRVLGEEVAQRVEGLGPVHLTQGKVWLASLVRPLEPPAPARLEWLRQTGRLFDETGDANGDAGARGALWAACEGAASAVQVPGPADGEPDFAEWLAQCSRAGTTLRALLRALTGEDLLEAMRPVLVRHLAAHLDLGLVAWTNPDRALGLYAAWRQAGLQDLAWGLADMPDAPRHLQDLPDDALACVEAELAWRGVPDEAREAHVTRLMLELPGWSGMVLWRHGHPETPGGTRVEMVDFLAVRLVLERLFAEELSLRVLGAHARFAALLERDRLNPGELAVRLAYHQGVLPEELAKGVEALLVQGPEVNPAWSRVYANWRAAPGAGPADAHVWRLYQLARGLELDAAAVWRQPPGGPATLLACAGRLGADTRGLIWLTAYERHYHEQVFGLLAANHGRHPGRPGARFQVVFCMDDREEGTRRHLEELDPRIETFGAAGFFGVAMRWRGLDDKDWTSLCPVVVRPIHAVEEQPREFGLTLRRYRERQSWRQGWREHLHRYTRRAPLLGAAVAGLTAPGTLAVLAGRVLAPGAHGLRVERWGARFAPAPATSLALTAASEAAGRSPQAPQAGFTDAEQADRVEAFLRTVGLSDGFGHLVLMLGHGSTSQNNPHRSAYDCGACSGRHGGPNARAFAAMANRPEVRALLAARGVVIPAETWFVAAQHDTCDDGVEWYDLEDVPERFQPYRAELKHALDEACARHAAERCRRFAKASPDWQPEQALRHVQVRRRDFSQARPELGHATNSVALVGRRSMSRGTFLDRRAFLVSYDPTRDADGQVLESILLAVGPVGAGINLEYYFSTVNNAHFGCGTKVAHNLVGQFGVMEGTGSDLRTGLPWQMVEIHEAMRLLVVVEQSREVVEAIYARQPPVQELVGNGWLLLAVKAPDSAAIHRFEPGRGWVAWRGEAVPPLAASSEACYRGQREALPPTLLARPPAGEGRG